MKMNYDNAIISIALVVFLVYILLCMGKESFDSGEGCQGKSDNGIPSDRPEDNAAEACKTISSEAENIKAAGNASAEILRNIPGVSLFNPNNYRAGDNTTIANMRNIITTNLSTCEQQKISSLCKQSTTASQSNKIDTTNCEYCNTHGCDIIGNTQTNTAVTAQTCELRVGISALLSKKNSVKAQALAKVLQEAEGLLSGSNEFKSENCNIIDKDMSTSKWLETKNECLTSSGLLQDNTLIGCGNIMNNLQTNTSETLQDCVQGTDIRSENTLKDSTDITQDIDSSQISSGLDTMASIISSVVAAISSSFFCCILIAILYALNQENSE
jgi:hypothetical protein